MRSRVQLDLLNKGDLKHANWRVHRTGIENHKCFFWTLTDCTCSLALY